MMTHTKVCGGFQGKGCMVSGVMGSYLLDNGVQSD